MSGEVELHAPGPLRGELRLPGDKSISHRAFLVNALAHGDARVRGVNPGEDVRATRRVLRALGVPIREDGPGWRVTGRGARLRPATQALDCGNSGTTLRLLSGICAAQDFTSTLDGDASLRSRPMSRIARPLRTMGARVEGPDGGRSAPLIITGGALKGGRYVLPVASAQVKSSILLAAVASEVAVEIEEPGQSRDHTERLLQAMGARIEFSGGLVRFEPGARLTAVDVEVPADPSSAALVGAAVLLVPGSQVRFPDLALNPTRVAFLDVLRRMGASIELEESSQTGGEASGALRLADGPDLVGTEVLATEVPRLIDEIPALAAVASVCRGATRFCGIGELRVKESDRLRAVIELLAVFGIEAHEEGDDLVVMGGELRAPERVRTTPDHRMQMTAAALMLGALARGARTRAILEGSGDIDVSHPGFFQDLNRLLGRTEA